MEDIKLIKNNLEINSIINHFNNTIINENNNKGAFKILNSELKIIWDIDKSKEEIYKLIDTVNNINIYLLTESSLELNLYYYDNGIVNNHFTINKINKNIYCNNKIYGKIILINNILNIYWNHNNNHDQFDILKEKKYYYSNYLLKNLFTKININKSNYIHTYLINNVEIFDEDFPEINYQYRFIEDDIIEIDKLIYKLDKDMNIFNEMRISTYERTIYIIHPDWQEECIINEITKHLYRKSLREIEYGEYTLTSDNLIIYWDKWDSEVFSLNHFNSTAKYVSKYKNQ
jgi:hypothetical protein